jgi:uncharacterized OsmC-like protein
MTTTAKEQPKISKRRAEATVLRGVRMDVKVRDLPPIVVDEPDTRGGTNEGPSPLEYVTSGLAGCQAVMVERLAGKMRIPYRNLRVTAETHLTQKPSTKGGDMVIRFCGAVLDVYMDTDADPKQLERLKVLAEERCPASNLFLDAGCNPTVNWHFSPLDA